MTTEPETPMERNQRRLAELDKLIELRLPALEAIGPLTPTRFAEAGAAAKAAFELAQRGPRDFGPPGFKRHRERWAAPNLATEWLKLRRISKSFTREAMAQMEGYRRRWAAIAQLPEADRQLLAARDIAAARVIEMAPPLSNRIVPPFDPRAFVRELAARGVSLEVDAGDVVASPAALLRPAHRECLGNPARKFAIMQTLASTARF